MEGRQTGRGGGGGETEGRGSKSGAERERRSRDIEGRSRNKRVAERESRDGDVEGRARSGAEREGRDRDVEGRGSRSGFEIEGTGRDMEGRASRSITERESRGRDEDGRGGRIGAEKERRGRDVVVSRLGFVRTFTGRGRGRPTIRVDTRRVVAQLRANHLLSATQCGPVMDLITKSYPSIAKAAQIVSRDTVLRAVVEGAIVHDQQLAEKMAKSEDLLICIDESSKSAG